MSPTERYREVGVDLNVADRAKQRMAAAVSSTFTPLTVGGFGAFGGMVRVPDDIERPALVMSTDGVGTKVLLAILAGVHNTVGEDLVNHSVNDILVHGATPLAFMDYLAGSDMNEDLIASVVEGVAKGCRVHSMSLAGGETAQMPGLYTAGHYDLAGTIVGVVSEESALHCDKVSVGDCLIGYASNGLHTNGYTLARHIVFEKLGLNIDSQMPGLGGTVADLMLAVHTSYSAAVRPVLDRLNSLAHITGGGIQGNLIRSLPTGCGAKINKTAWVVPPLFQLLQDAGQVDESEMFRVFNMGIGMIAAVSPADVDKVCAVAAEDGISTWTIGEVVSGKGVEIG